MLIENNRIRMSRMVSLTFCFGILCLTNTIYGDDSDNENKQLITLLKDMAASNEFIDNEFRPLKDGFIKEGGFGVVYKGERVWDKRFVALKFMKMKNEKDANREYEMYSYLNAIENGNIEQIGFCSIYYFKKWNNYMLMAMSLLTDGDLSDKATQGFIDDSVENQSINSLILFRDFVRQSKYMHAHGIRHDDIKPGNMMLRGHRCFIIDFNLSAKMLDPNNGVTLQFASRAYHKGQNLTAIDDWESFLYSMCFIHRIELRWFHSHPFHGLDTEHANQQYSCMKDQTGGTIAKIEMSILSDPLKRVFIEFANEIFRKRRVTGFAASTLPDYDRLHRIITAEIETIIGKSKPALFTWLFNPSDIQNALDEFGKGSFDIGQIEDPPFSFRTFNYPSVNYTYFAEREAKPAPINPQSSSYNTFCQLYNKKLWGKA